MNFDPFYDEDSNRDLNVFYRAASRVIVSTVGLTGKVLDDGSSSRLGLSFLVGLAVSSPLSIPLVIAGATLNAARKL